MGRLRQAAVAAVLLCGACTPSGDGEHAEGPAATAAEPSANESAVDVPDGPVAEPVRHPMSERLVYFVMPDRFANGDASNDAGGLGDDPLVSGFLPTDTGFHHGGDLIGLTNELPYLAELGVGAIWITPPFANNAVQGNGTIEGSSSGYHGYWQIDWSRIDPHLGTEDDMHAFVDAAHALDMLVIFDIVVNHTGDIISYADDSYVYYSTAARPYLDAEGTEFDPAAVAGDPATFPSLDAAISFPHPPTFASPELADAKWPEWLNDVTHYHNRGNSTFSGESSLYGDFFGLDDLFTEHPAVVAGMTELHASLIERYDIDGFRIDTMKHVDDAFWAQFAPAIVAAAEAAGKPDFFFFGEVATPDPIQRSNYTNLGVSATLDFTIDDALQRYLNGGTGADLAAAFDDDDWFTDADNNASMEVSFIGNHDEGRLGSFLVRANHGADDAELLARATLAYDLLFLTRGVPVVYYGDEQGFTGDGGDQLARQDMFASLTPEYLDDESIGSDATPADDNFDPTHPLFTHIRSLVDLRAAHPALVHGAQIVHEVPGPLFAFSRIDRDERVEYVVVTNANGSLAVPARFEVLSPDTSFIEIGGSRSFTSDTGGEILLEVEPFETIVLRAETPLAVPTEAAAVRIVRPDGDTIPTPRYRIEVELDGQRSATAFAQVTFAVSADGAEPRVIGVDDAAPYRVYWDTTSVPNGATVEVVATSTNGSGHYETAKHTATMARP